MNEEFKIPNRQKIVEAIENYVLQRAGNIKRLGTVLENAFATRYVTEKMLGLTPEEYAKAYSTVFNKKYEIQRYVTSISKLAPDQAYFGQNSKNQILKYVYPRWKNPDANENELVQRLLENDEPVLRYIYKINDRERAYKIVFRFLVYLLDHFEFENIQEKYDFLLYADAHDMALIFKCFNIIKANYCCMLDFYFVHLPDKQKEEELLPYLRTRCRVPQMLDVIAYTFGLDYDKLKQGQFVSARKEDG